MISSQSSSPSPLSRALSSLSRLSTPIPSPQSRSLSSSSNNEELIKFYFIEAKDGSKIEVKGKVGKTVLDIALDHDIDIEGACGGELACSTCHVILSNDLYNLLPIKKEEEEDMLDLAYGLKPTSRLCCQIKVSKDIENEIFTVPSETNNMLG
jgi:ferredoxin